MASSQSTLEILVKLKDETKSSFGSLGKSLEGLGGVAKKAGIALGAIGVAAGTGLAFAVKAASDAQVEMAKMDTTLKNMGDAAMANRDAILDAADAAAQLGFDDEAAALSITNLYQRTNDLAEATKLNTLAMDLSRAKGIELGDASRMISMVMSGNARALKEYGIELSDTLTPMQALDELQQKVGGNAQAFGATFAGQMEILKTAFGNMVEQIGEKVLPVITTLATKYVPIIIDAFTRFADAVGRAGSIALDYLPTWEQFKGWIDTTKKAIADFIELTAPLWDIFKQSLSDLWLVIKFQLWPSIKELWDALQPLVPIIGVALYLAVITITKALTAFFAIVGKIIDIIVLLIGYFKEDLNRALSMSGKDWLKLLNPINLVVAAIKEVWNWAKRAIEMVKELFSLKGGDKKSEKKVDDAVISPSGSIVSTNPKDWLIATQNPALLTGGSSISIYLQGDFYTDTESANKYSDTIARNLKNQLILGGLRA